MFYMGHSLKMLMLCFRVQGLGLRVSDMLVN